MSEIKNKTSRQKITEKLGFSKKDVAKAKVRSLSELSSESLSYIIEGFQRDLKGHKKADILIQNLAERAIWNDVLQLENLLKAHVSEKAFKLISEQSKKKKKPSLDEIERVFNTKGTMKGALGFDKNSLEFPTFEHCVPISDMTHALINCDGSEEKIKEILFTYATAIITNDEEKLLPKNDRINWQDDYEKAQIKFVS